MCYYDGSAEICYSDLHAGTLLLPVGVGVLRHLPSRVHHQHVVRVVVDRGRDVLVVVDELVLRDRTVNLAAHLEGLDELQQHLLLGLLTALHVGVTLRRVHLTELVHRQLAVAVLVELQQLAPRLLRHLQTRRRQVPTERVEELVVVDLTVTGLVEPVEQSVGLLPGQTHAETLHHDGELVLVQLTRLVQVRPQEPLAQRRDTTGTTLLQHLLHALLQHAHGHLVGRARTATLLRPRRSPRRGGTRRSAAAERQVTRLRLRRRRSATLLARQLRRGSARTRLAAAHLQGSALRLVRVLRVLAHAPRRVHHQLEVVVTVDGRRHVIVVTDPLLRRDNSVTPVGGVLALERLDELQQHLLLGLLSGRHLGVVLRDRVLRPDLVQRHGVVTVGVQDRVRLHGDVAAELVHLTTDPLQELVVRDRASVVTVEVVKQLVVLLLGQTHPHPLHDHHELATVQRLAPVSVRDVEPLAKGTDTARTTLVQDLPEALEEVVHHFPLLCLVLPAIRNERSKKYRN
eukprot:Hpha_TRINITY_DN16288_c1_g2::TRINITY_DN16288_c1_g2_i1::g.13321::m.13321